MNVASFSLSTTTVPAKSGTAKMVIILLHGVGADGGDLANLSQYWHETLPDAAFVAPNAPSAYDMVPPGYPTGFQWFSLADTSPEGLRNAVEAAAPTLEHYLDEVLAAYDLGAKQFALIGFSQGTMMALHVGLRYRLNPSAIIGFSGTLLPTLAFPRDVKQRPPVLLVHGEADPVIPHATMARSEAALKLANVPVTSLSCPGVGHSIDQTGIARARDFLQMHLGGGV